MKVLQLGVCKRDRKVKEVSTLSFREWFRSFKKKTLRIIFILVLSLVYVPVCFADVGKVIAAPVKIAEELLWIPAMAAIISVSVPMCFLMKLEESIQKKETENVS